MGTIGTAADLLILRQRGKTSVFCDAIVGDADRDYGDLVRWELEGAFGDTKDAEREREDAAIV